MTTVTHQSEIYTIARCLKELIVNQDIDDALNNIVEWLTESLNIDRCYISEAYPNGINNRLTSIYAGPHAGKANSLKQVQDLIFNTGTFPEIQELLQQNQSFKVSVTDNISSALYDFLDVSDLKSLLLIPLHTGNHYWGFIGFGDTVNIRTWRKSEGELTSLSVAISMAMERSKKTLPTSKAMDGNISLEKSIAAFSWLADLHENILHTEGEALLFVKETALKSLESFVEYALKHIHPDDVERVKSRFAAFLLQSKMDSDEDIFRVMYPATNEYQWLHCKHNLVKNDKHECIGVSGRLTSVIETQKIARKLAAQKDEYEFLFESGEYVNFSLNKRGDITGVTAAWQKMLGYDEKESIGKNLIEYLPREEIRSFWEHFGNLLHNQAQTIDCRMCMQHKNGESIWVRIIAKSTRDDEGNITGVFGNIENINNNFTAEILLKESNNKLTNILNNSQEIILTIDLEKNIIENVNDAISILGYQPHEWIGQQYQHWNRDQRDKFHELMKLAVKSQLQVANQQITFTNRNTLCQITFEFSTNLFVYKGSKYLLCVLRDISERVQYEKNITRISEQLSHLINNIDDVYAIYDMQSSRFEFVSNNVETLYGCDKELFCEKGLIWNEIVHRDDLPGIEKSIKQITANKTKGEFFYRIAAPNGHTKMVLEKVTVGKNSKGEVEKLYIVKTDYTHIENIERSFIESERKFRFISENISDFISIHDPDWNFTYASPSVKTILGYEPEEIAGMAGFDLVHPDDLVKTLDELLQPLVLEHKETHLRYRLKAKNGDYKWVETYSKAVVDTKGQTTSIISSTRDVTNQVLAETKLKTSEEQYRLLSENSNDVIATYNLCGLFTYVSPSSLQVLGYHASELIGQCSAEILAKDEANKAIVKSSIRIVENSKEPKTFIYQAQTKNGEVKILEVVLQPVYKNDEFFAIQAASRDVTEREQLLVELELSLEKERELNELRSIFVATASHQFRTPLTIIQSGVEIMELYLTDLPDAKQVRFQKQFKSIQSEVERLEFLMSDILLLGRANAARTPYTPQQGNLVKFIENILEEKYNNRYTADRSVLLKITGLPVEMDFDPKLLGHAIENIINNAYKYSDKGNLEVHVNFTKAHVKLTISDKGIGIPPEDLKNLFQPFYRATNTSDIEGTGLGLAIVKEFIEKHKGKIFLTSKLNKGTNVNVILPIKYKTS